MHFGKTLTVLQFSTFVNENIAIMLDSGIDIVVLLQGGVNLFQGGELNPCGVAGYKPLLRMCTFWFKIVSFKSFFVRPFRL